MRRVIQVEQPAQPMRSPLTVIQRKQGNGEHGPPLGMPDGQAQNCQPREKCPDAASAEVHDHRQHHAPKAVIHMEAGHIQRKLFTNKIDTGKQGRSGKSRAGRPLFLRIFHRADQPYRQGEGHQDTLVQGASYEPIDHLTHHRQPGKPQKIPHPIVGIVAALGDHVGVDGHGKPADDPKKPVLGQKHGPDVVNGHGEQCEKLQLIAGKSEPGANSGHRRHLLVSAHYSTLSMLRQWQWTGAETASIKAVKAFHAAIQQPQFSTVRNSGNSRKIRGIATPVYTLVSCLKNSYQLRYSLISLLICSYL